MILKVPDWSARQLPEDYELQKDYQIDCIQEFRGNFHRKIL